MALTATFVANFSNFYDAVDKAAGKIVDFGTGVEKVGEKLGRFTDQFSGKQLIQQATIMARAVEDIGGVTKLTESELAKLGSTTNTAVEKMKKLGMDVPANLQKIADETKNANKETTNWLGLLGKAAAALGIAFSLDAIKAFIGSVFDAASAVKNLADQWGVSTTAVQQFSGAAKASGVEVETVGKSIQFLTEQLGEGSKAYRSLLENVGLSYDKLRKMPLEEAYKEVIKAIAGIKDETLQLDVAQGLLGISSKKMVGTIRDGFLEAAAAQEVMSDTTIRRLEAAQAQWEKFKNSVIIYSGEMLAAVMKTTDGATSSWNRFFRFSVAGLESLTGGPAVADFFALGQDMAKSTDQATAATMRLASSHGDLSPKIKTTAEVLKDLKDKEDAAKAAQADRQKALDEEKKAQEAYNKAIADYSKSIDDLSSSLSGADLINKATKYLQALEKSIPVQDMTAEKQAEINKVMQDAMEVYLAAGAKIPDALWDIWRATHQLKVETENYTESLGSMNGALKQFMNQPIDLTKIGTNVKLPDPSIWAGAAQGIAGAMSSAILRAIEGGGDILQAAGSAVGSFLLDPKKSGIGKSIETAASKLPGIIGGAINAAIPVVGSLIGPAVSWLGEKIMGWFGKKEHEKMRDNFIEAAGGITALTIAARDAGTSLDALLSAGNKKDLQKAIDDLNAAFQFQDDTIQLVMDTAKKYGFTLEELGPALSRQELDKQAQQIFKDWEVLNDAGIDSVAIINRMSDSVNEYIHHAMKMGSEIPQAMRPMLEDMAKAGKLTDENGDAIEDLDKSGLKFTMTMSEGFQKLIDQVTHLADVIGRSLGIAIRDVPDVKVKGTVEWDVPPVPAPGHAQANIDMESYQEGTDGFRNFGKGTPVMLHGWEAVVPRENSEAFAALAPGAMATAAAGDSTTVVVNAQGAFFDTPESLQRLASKVSDALTAKYSINGKLRAAV